MPPAIKSSIFRFWGIIFNSATFGVHSSKRPILVRRQYSKISPSLGVTHKELLLAFQDDRLKKKMKI